MTVVSVGASVISLDDPVGPSDASVILLVDVFFTAGSVVGGSATVDEEERRPTATFSDTWPDGTTDEVVRASFVSVFPGGSSVVEIIVDGGFVVTFGETTVRLELGDPPELLEGSALSTAAVLPVAI